MRLHTDAVAPGALGELQCATCGSNGPFTPALKVLLRCLDCGLVFADPRLSPEEIRQLYGPNYFNGDEYADYLGDKAAIQRSFRRKIAYMSRVAPGIRRVLEIGAAYGFFLDLARVHWEVAGVELAAEPAAFARERLNLNVWDGEFLRAPIAPGYYDGFCLWDTIEHLARPDEYIARIAELITPGGFLFISTGDIDAWLPRRQGPSWRLIHPPTHLYYFSRWTLSHLLRRYGFQVRDITATGMYRTIRQTLYSLVLQRRNATHGLAWRLAGSPLGRLSYYLNLGDIMTVVAQAPTGPDPSIHPSRSLGAP